MSFLGNKNREDELFYALAQELSPAETATEANAVTPDAEVQNTLASVIDTLVKCADKLEGLGHPGVEHINDLLAFIEKDFLNKQGE